MILRTIKQTVLLAAFAGLLAACNKQDTPDIPESRLFATPEAAVDAFVTALESKDKQALMTIFGPEGDRLLSSGDAVADAADRKDFLEAYRNKHAIIAEGELRILNVGVNDWPLPIPLASQGGKWYFDTEAGAEELINRRIGENELGAISAAHGFVAAQQEYASEGRDGLYWQTSEGEPASPIGPLVAAAAAEGYDAATAEAYHGYRYRMLYKQGGNAPGGPREYFNNGRLTDGFALLAWPAEYGASGMKTFMVNQDGVVYEKDLGPETATAVAAIDSFDPDASWMKVEEITVAE